MTSTRMITNMPRSTVPAALIDVGDHFRVLFKSLMDHWENAGWTFTLKSKIMKASEVVEGLLPVVFMRAAQRWASIRHQDLNLQRMVLVKNVDVTCAVDLYMDENDSMMAWPWFTIIASYVENLARTQNALGREVDLPAVCVRLNDEYDQWYQAFSTYQHMPNLPKAFFLAQSPHPVEQDLVEQDRLEQGLNLNSVQDVVFATVEGPFESLEDWSRAMATFGATTLTWSDPWFQLAWHGVMTLMPEQPAVGFRVAQRGREDKNLQVPPLVVQRAAMTRNAIDPDQQLREALADGLHPDRPMPLKPLTASERLDVRLGNAPLHDPDLENAHLNASSTLSDSVASNQKKSVDKPFVDASSSKDSWINVDERWAARFAALTHHWERLGWRFTVKSSFFDNDEILKNQGLLPPLMWEALQHWSTLSDVAFNRNTLAFALNKEALCTAEVYVQHDDALPWDAILEAFVQKLSAATPDNPNETPVKGPSKTIALDETYDQWYDAAQKRELTLLQMPKVAPQPPVIYLTDVIKAVPSFRSVVSMPLRKFADHETYEVLHTGVELKTVGMDLDAWQTSMDRSFPWMRSLTARLMRRLSIQAAHGKAFKLPTLGLLGDPGVGKTWYWRVAMQRLGHPLTVLSLAGNNDSMVIKGTSAGWSTERPGLAARTMALTRCANPVVLLDEADKTGGNSHDGRTSDALLALLEPSTASVYHDECLLQELDTSHISWVLTLNEEERLSPALRNRMELIEVHGPDWSNPDHVNAALAMGERLAWKAWDPDMCTPATELSEPQRTHLRSVRWKSLRSLGQAIAGLLEENLYAATVETRLSTRPTPSADANPSSSSWREVQ